MRGSYQCQANFLDYVAASSRKFNDAMAQNRQFTSLISGRMAYQLWHRPYSPIFQFVSNGAFAYLEKCFLANVRHNLWKIYAK